MCVVTFLDTFCFIVWTLISVVVLMTEKEKGARGHTESCRDWFSEIQVGFSRHHNEFSVVSLRLLLPDSRLEGVPWDLVLEEPHPGQIRLTGIYQNR